MLQLLEARNVYIGIVSVSIRDLQIRELGLGPGPVSRTYWACALILLRSQPEKTRPPQVVDDEFLGLFTWRWGTL